MNITPSERFWRRVTKTETCWLWNGALNEGYGRFSYGSSKEDGYKTIAAHRWSFEEINRPIPFGLQIDHLCRTRNCVRPDHLEAVTPRENTLRSTAASSLNAKKTHCLRGHKFDEQNTIKVGRNRRCRTCENEKFRRRRASMTSVSEERKREIAERNLRNRRLVRAKAKAAK